MLIKKFGETEKGKKRLCLITDALFPIKEPYEGTKEDQVTTIAQQMTKHGMRMDSVVVRGRFGQDADEKMMDENDLLLKIFSEKTNAKMVYVESPTSLLGAIRTRSIAPVTIFRGDLEISSIIKIKVAVSYLHDFMQSIFIDVRIEKYGILNVETFWLRIRDC